MFDDLDEVFAAPPAAPPVADRSLTRAIDNLSPLIDAVRTTLAEGINVRLDEATPAQREEVVRLHALLTALQAPLKMRLDALDAHARAAMNRLHADQLPVAPERYITLDAGRGGYDTNEHDLRAELLRLAEGGALTRDEVNDAITEQISYVANHARLNYLARHRGAAVEAAIKRHRKRVEPDMSRARVRWPKEGTDAQ